MAVYCRVRPEGRLASAGVTASETGSALVAVKAAVPSTAPEEARTVVLPTPVAVSSPVVSTVATEASSVDHAEPLLTSAVDPSL